MKKKKDYITDQLMQNVLLNMKWKRIQELPQIKDINKKIEELEKTKNELTDKAYSTEQALRNQEITIISFDLKTENILRNIDELNKEIKKKEKERSEMIGSLGDEYNMNRFKEFFPNFYEEFEKDFNEFFNKWLEITSDQKATKSIKSEIKQLFQSQVIDSINANPHLVNSLEHLEENPYNRLSKSLVNQSFQLANILLLSLNKNNWIAIDTIMEQNRNIEELKHELSKKREKPITKVKGRRGKTGQFSSINDLTKKIKEISNSKNLSFNKLAQELGYYDGSGLRDLLKKYTDWHYELMKLNIPCISNTINNISS